MRFSASNTVSSPTRMRPSSGCWKPAIDISVVDFPQPLGPSSVKSSPSATWKPTSFSARWSPNSLTSLSTCISGTVIPSRDSDLEQLRADAEHDDGDRDLHHGESGDRPGHALDELRQHRGAHHLRAGLHEEDRRVVVVDDLDEEQDER